MLMLSSRVLPFSCKKCIEVLREMPILKAQIVELQSDIKELKVGDQARKQSYADVLKFQDVSETLRGGLDSLKKKVEVMSSLEEPIPRKDNIEPTIEELREREKRSANVLIFGVSESELVDKEQRIQQELSTVESLLKRADKDVQIAAVKAHRLGKFSKDKVRPIRVTFPTRECALKVLKQRQKISEGSAVYVKSDQTPLQRDHLRELLAELHERTRNGGEKLKIRYVNSTPKIVPDREGRQSKN